MEKNYFRQGKALLTFILLVLCCDVWCISKYSLIGLDEDNNIEEQGDWSNGGTSRSFSPPVITQNSQSLTIQDYNPVNTITVRITHNDSGATVFENVYPKGQTSFIVIPMNGWSAGSYTIELFGRENNGYLWGTFQVLP